MSIDTYTATTTSGTALAANVKRAFASIGNAGPETAFLNIGGGDAEVNKGILLPPGYSREFVPAPGSVNHEVWPQGEVTAITASGTAVLCVFEQDAP
jgi:hypothetical protein